MISIYTQFSYFCWMVLFAIWILGHLNNKKTLQRPEMKKYLVTTFMLVISYFFLFFPYSFGTLSELLFKPNYLLGIIGSAISALGVMFAIWARFAIGSNWSGSTATIKENHELITDGPYHFVRHPIYTGFLLAMIGTALTIGTLTGFIGVAIGLFAFLIRIKTEESLMLKYFPKDYSNYIKETEKIIPFIW